MVKLKFHYFYFCLEVSSFSVVLNKQMEDEKAENKLKLVTGIM